MSNKKYVDTGNKICAPRGKNIHIIGSMTIAINAGSHLLFRTCKTVCHILFPFGLEVCVEEFVSFADLTDFQYFQFSKMNFAIGNKDNAQIR